MLTTHHVNNVCHGLLLLKEAENNARDFFLWWGGMPYIKTEIICTYEIDPNQQL